MPGARQVPNPLSTVQKNGNERVQEKQAFFSTVRKSNAESPKPGSVIKNTSTASLGGEHAQEAKAALGEV